MTRNFRSARNLENMRFGKLTALSRAVNVKGRVMWNCVCDCGIEKPIRADSLLSGHAKSCGCIRIELFTNRVTKHGITAGLNREKILSEYAIWVALKDRCKNPNNKMYKHYGKRGIKVCDSWVKSFEKFYEDMGPRPAGTSLDRINNDGNYEPENCRWATEAEQKRNTSRNIFVEYLGEKMCLKDFSKKSGHSYYLAHRALKENIRIEDLVEYLEAQQLKRLL